MENKQNFIHRRPILVGILILTSSFVIGTLLAIFVVECSVPSKAGNDGWLGFLGGVSGSMISGLISFYILYLDRQKSEEIQENNRRETNNLQKEHRKEFEYQVRKQFIDNIASNVARYITSIHSYFDCQYFNTNKDTNRVIAVEEYYILVIKLEGIPQANALLTSLNKIHKEYCFFDPDNKRLAQRKRFDIEITTLKDETSKFIKSYLEN